MKPFDELIKMTDDERLAYLESEVEKVIQNARPEIQLKLRAVQAKCNGIRRTVKSPLAAAAQIQGLMLDSLMELQKNLSTLTGRN